MSQRIPRRSFLAAAGVGAAALGAGARRTVAQPAQDAPPPLDYDQTRWVVLVAHQKQRFDEWRAKLEADPRFVNATMDWRHGDIESALGAAAHMGFREHARLLLDLGARLNIFAAATLGYLEVVRAIVAVEPDAPFRLGPHGIPLIAHARHGGATEVAEYLASLGADDGENGFTTKRLDRYTGDYVARTGERVRVRDDSGSLQIRVGADDWPLTHVERHTWRRAGDSASRISFRMNGVGAWGVRVEAGQSLDAVRVFD